VLITTIAKLVVGLAQASVSFAMMIIMQKMAPVFLVMTLVAILALLQVELGHALDVEQEVTI